MIDEFHIITCKFVNMRKTGHVHVCNITISDYNNNTQSWMSDTDLQLSDWLSQTGRQCKISTINIMIDKGEISTYY